MDIQSPSSSSADPHPSAQAYANINTAIKCLKEGECQDKIDAWAAACAGQEPPPDNNEACVSARAALMKCIINDEAAASDMEEEQELKSG